MRIIKNISINGNVIYVSSSAEAQTIFEHNLFDSIGAEILYNVETNDYTVQDNWWGSDMSSFTHCDDGTFSDLCMNASGIPNIPTVSLSNTEWPLCNPDVVPDCVEASQ
jgi:hypothetical protein